MSAPRRSPKAKGASRAFFRSRRGSAASPWRATRRPRTRRRSEETSFEGILCAAGPPPARIAGGLATMSKHFSTNWMNPSRSSASWVLCDRTPKGCRPDRLFLCPNWTQRFVSDDVARVRRDCFSSKRAKLDSRAQIWLEFNPLPSRSLPSPPTLRHSAPESWATYRRTMCVRAQIVSSSTLRDSLGF